MLRFWGAGSELCCLAAPARAFQCLLSARPYTRWSTMHALLVLFQHRKPAFITADSGGGRGRRERRRRRCGRHGQASCQGVPGCMSALLPVDPRTTAQTDTPVCSERSTLQAPLRRVLRRAPSSCMTRKCGLRAGSDLAVVPRCVCRTVPGWTSALPCLVRHMPSCAAPKEASLSC